jgi:putative ABC transport system permease protein
MIDRKVHERLLLESHMSWKRTLARVIGVIRSNDQRREELRKEIQAHVELETQENIDRGMGMVEARRVAVLKFGAPELVFERAAGEWSLPTVDSIVADARYGFRALWKARTFSIVSVLIMALGIGATTAIFSVAYSILVRPLPYGDPERLFLVHQYDKAHDTGNWRATALDFLDWRERAKSFDGMAGYTGTGLIFAGSGPAEMVLGQSVSFNLFEVLGVQPRLGRGFRYEEEEKGKNQVIVLSYGLWQQKFGGSASVIGNDIAVNGLPYTIVGVMPPAFAFPDRQYAAWVPQPLRGGTDRQWVNRSAHFLRVISRLKQGVTKQQAADEIASIQRALEQQYPETDINEGARIQSLTESVIGNARSSLLLLLGAAGLLLLIACANVANLLLARSTSRQQEIAVRQALGATRIRILRQLLTENLVLTVIGGTLGCGVAYGIVAAVLVFGPSDLPRLNEIRVDAAALLFALAISMATGVLFGFTPITLLRKEDSSTSVRTSNMSSSPALQKLRQTFVTAEIAISMALLIAALLTVRTLMALNAVDPGFNPDHTITFNMVLMENRYRDGSALRQMVRTAADEFAAVHGVTAVGITSARPLGGNAWTNPVTTDTSTDSTLVGIRLISPGYFAAMQTPMRRGRPFNSGDNENAPRVAIVTEAGARKLFGDSDPIGRHVQLGNARSNGPWREIVGVAGDVHDSALDAPPEPLFFVPYDQLGDPLTAMAGRGLDVVLRGTDDPTSELAGVRSRLHRLDPSVPMHDVQTLSEAVAGSIAQPRFRTYLFTSFGIVGVIMAAVGLYGVLSYAVAQRAHEFGIRIALGASRVDLLKLVGRYGSVIVGFGMITGFVLSLLISSPLRTMLFGISAIDVRSWVLAAIIIAVVATVAIVVPARHAMNVDPLEVIRYE